jgi:hypothetical protein
MQHIRPRRHARCKRKRALVVRNRPPHLPAPRVNQHNPCPANRQPVPPQLVLHRRPTRSRLRVDNHSIHPPRPNRVISPLIPHAPLRPPRRPRRNMEAMARRANPVVRSLQPILPRRQPPELGHAITPRHTGTLPRNSGPLLRPIGAEHAISREATANPIRSQRTPHP